MAKDYRVTTRYGRRVGVLWHKHYRDLATGLEVCSVDYRRWQVLQLQTPGWRPISWATFDTPRGAFRAVSRAEALVVLVRSLLQIARPA